MSQQNWLCRRLRCFLKFLACLRHAQRTEVEEKSKEEEDEGSEVRDEKDEARTG